MQTTLRIIAAVCSLGALFGCASNPMMAEMKIVPTMQVKHSNESADGHYRLGRYYHGSQRWEEAQKSYQQAIALEPEHVGARNALAVLYAERGEYAKAISLLRVLTKTVPDASDIRSNLGYAYYLNGDYELARASLEKASRLDSKNTRAWYNLGKVLERLGKTEQARSAFAQAQAAASGVPLQPHQRGATLTGAQSSQVPAPVYQVRDMTAGTDLSRWTGSAQGVREESAATTEITQVGSAVYEIRQAKSSFAAATSSNSSALPRVHQETRAAPKPRAALPGTVVASEFSRPAKSMTASTHRLTGTSAAPNRAVARVEVSNGNGVRGMAKSIGQVIASSDRRIVRLTNQPYFNVKFTRIEYNKKYEHAARTLAHALGGSISVVLSNAKYGPDIRLVLGKDMQDAHAVSLHYRKYLEVAKKNDSEWGGQLRPVSSLMH